MASPLKAPGVVPTCRILARATWMGAASGATFGGLLMTLAFPVVGTFFGAIFGAIFGATSGLVNGLVLAGLAALSPSRDVERVVGAVTSVGCIGVFFAWAIPPWQVPGMGIMFVMVVCALFGLALAPFAVHGARPLKLGRRLGERSAGTYIGGAIGAGTALGAVLGAGWGLVLVVRTPMPTAPATIIEGGLLGAVSGAVLGLLVVAVAIAPRLRVR